MRTSIHAYGNFPFLRQSGRRRAGEHTESLFFYRRNPTETISAKEAHLEESTGLKTLTAPCPELVSYGSQLPLDYFQVVLYCFQESQK